MHNAEYTALPAPRTAKKEEPSQQQQQGAEEKTKKRHRTVDEDDVVEFVGRNLLAFSVLDDPLFKGVGVTRKNVVEKMINRCKPLRTALLELATSNYVSFAFDSGLDFVFASARSFTRTN